MDKPNLFMRFLRVLFPEPYNSVLKREFDALADKCQARGEEIMVLNLEIAALKLTIANAREDYAKIKREVPDRIIGGSKAGAVHADRIEYENNRLRVFASTVHRLANDLIAQHARLNKDLERSKNGVLGGLVRGMVPLTGFDPP